MSAKERLNLYDRIPQTYSEKNLIDTTFIPTVSTIIKIK